MVSVPDEPMITDADMGCRHHWDIAAANGLYSQGVCSLCGETRMFANFIGASQFSTLSREGKPSPMAGQRSCPAWQDIDELCLLYTQGMSIQELADRFGHEKGQVEYVIKASMNRDDVAKARAEHQGGFGNRQAVNQ